LEQTTEPGLRKGHKIFSVKGLPVIFSQQNGGFMRFNATSMKIICILQSFHRRTFSFGITLANY
jgi:hypothetical protein